MAYKQAEPHRQAASHPADQTARSYYYYLSSTSSLLLQHLYSHPKVSAWPDLYLYHLLHPGIHISYPIVLGRDNMERDSAAFERLEVEC